MEDTVRNRMTNGAAKKAGNENFKSDLDDVLK